MGMDFELGILLAYAFGIIVLYVIGYVLLVPVKIIWKLVINSAIGGLSVLVINFLGGFIGFHIPLNILNAIIVGFLGIPGVGLLVLFDKFIF